MVTVGDRIRQVRQEQDVTQQELADYIGVSKQAVYKYENNIVTNIPTDKVDAIAKRLKVSPAYLMGWEEKPQPAPRPIPKGFEPMPKMKKIPLVGSIACGTPILAQQNIEKIVDAPVKVEGLGYEHMVLSSTGSTKHIAENAPYKLKVFSNKGIITKTFTSDFSNAGMLSQCREPDSHTEALE